MLLVTLTNPSAEELDHATNILGRYGNKRTEIHCVPNGASVHLVARVENGDGSRVQEDLAKLRSFGEVRHIDTPYVLSAPRRAKDQRTLVRASDRVVFGSNEFAVIAGPCSVESL